MTSLIDQVKTGFDEYSSYLLFAIIIILLIISFRKVSPVMKKISFYFILLIVDIVCLFFVNMSYIWIPFGILFFILFLIFTDQAFKQLFYIDHDNLFVESESLVWEKFQSPPEVKKIKDEGK